MPDRRTAWEIADRLDELGAHQTADAVRDVARRYESRWWRRLKQWWNGV